MLIDISRPIRRNIPVWPGDTPFTFELIWTKQQSKSVNVGRLIMSTHTGTHIDAPFHFDDKGKKVLALDLEAYIGLVRVIEIKGKSSIGAAELEPFHLTGVKRLIIKTNSWVNSRVFPSSYTFLRPDIAEYLLEREVRLIGVDVPSVDPLESKELNAHHQLHAFGIHILEGLSLEQAIPGTYELMALPLPLEEADGSPVRAVLRTIP